MAEMSQEKVEDEEEQTIESIELKVEEHPTEDHVDINIEQVTEKAPIRRSQSSENDDLLELGTGRDEVVVITEQDIAGMSDSKEHSMELPPENKTYDEWIFVDVNKTTYEVKENLLLLSSVYGGDQACCVVM